MGAVLLARRQPTLLQLDVKAFLKSLLCEVLAVEVRLQSDVRCDGELSRVLEPWVLVVAAAHAAAPVVAAPLVAANCALPVHQRAVARAALTARHLAERLPREAAVEGRATRHLPEAECATVKVVDDHVVLVPRTTAEQAPREAHGGVVGFDAVVVDVDVRAPVVLLLVPEQRLVARFEREWQQACSVHAVISPRVESKHERERAREADAARRVGDHAILEALTNLPSVEQPRRRVAVGVHRQVLLLH
mmetsp:Transcript_16584/g.42979  ORF Transcript_16584/g.42979 Transcript_16584/m.42979 type:complete len:248 (-) Transcript_16584:402-1145(-)